MTQVRCETDRVMVREERRYLLAIKELAGDSELCERAFALLDTERRRKASGKKGKPLFQSLGAGLLLQLAAEEEAGVAETPGGVLSLSVTELLRRLNSRREIRYTYGFRGKPYAVSPAFHFSLSHSGDYVFCAAADREIGADLQLVRRGGRGDAAQSAERRYGGADPCDWSSDDRERGNERNDRRTIRIAERFFTEEERILLRDCPEHDRERLFYRIWARKEAYGKWTGEGVADVLGICVLQGSNLSCAGGSSTGECERETTADLMWWESEFRDGEDTYVLAVCRGGIERQTHERLRDEAHPTEAAQRRQ